MKDVEFIERSSYMEETDYEEDYKLTIKKPSWHGYNVWYLMPNPKTDFVINEPRFIISSEGMYRFATIPDETNELKKYYEFYS